MKSNTQPKETVLPLHQTNSIPQKTSGEVGRPRMFLGIIRGTPLFLESVRVQC